jgi:N-acetylneuraminate synthase
MLEGDSLLPRVRVIAEAGVNHNGSLELALALVDAAAEAGADIVKFQTFQPEQLVSRHAPKADYQRRTTDAAESQLAMLRRLALGPNDYPRLLDRCRQKNIAFLSSAFDLDSLILLTRDLKLSDIKIGSGEITNAPLLLAIARAGCSAILSTGMSTLAEVRDALAVLAFGYTNPTETPSSTAFAAALTSEAGRAALGDHAILLHCTTEYPAAFEDVNLRAMDTLRNAFHLPVGFSDHTPGIVAPIAAVARGAVMIEKHLTLDRSLPGPDHAASLEPSEMAALVTGVRQTTLARGDGRKEPRPVEIKNMAVARKSLVAAKSIRRGEPFAETNMAAKRPGTGISPMRWWDILNRAAPRDFAVDELIEIQSE